MSAHLAKTLGGGLTEAKISSALKSMKLGDGATATTAAPTKGSTSSEKKEKPVSKAKSKVAAEEPPADTAASDVEAEEEPAPPVKAAKATKSKTATAKVSAGSAGTTVSKTASKKDASEEKHACEYTVKGENPHVCGKMGKTTEFEGMWYCGTEVSGHLASIMKAAKKNASAASATKAKSAPTKAKPVVPSKSEPKSEEVHLISVGSYRIHPKTRVAFDPSSRAAIGVLDKDNTTLKPMTDEGIRFCESRNLTISAKATKATKKTKETSTTATASATSKSAPVAKKGSGAGSATSKATVPQDENVDLGEEAPPAEEEVAEEVAEDAAEEQVDIQLNEDGEEEPDVEEEVEAGAEEGADEAEDEEEGGDGAEDEGGDEGDAGGDD